MLPLLARDPNCSSVPGSDAEPRLSDAGSGNEEPQKAARGRASLHGEVLVANKTLKKKPYKSLGWSLIAVRALAGRPFVRLFLGHRRHRANPALRVRTARRSETPLFCRSRRCRARARGRADVAQPASPPLGGELPSDASSSHASPDPFRPDPPRARLTAPLPSRLSRTTLLILIDALSPRAAASSGRLHGGRRGGPLQHRARAFSLTQTPRHLQRAHGRFRRRERRRARGGGHAAAASTSDALEPMTRAAFPRAVERRAAKSKSPKSGSKSPGPPSRGGARRLRRVGHSRREPRDGAVPTGRRPVARARTP